MECFEIESDFKYFQENLNALPNFYTNSNGNLDFLHEKNKNDFFTLNSDEICDIMLVLEELNKAIQINIDENYVDDCQEILSILRKPMGQTYQKSINHHKTNKKSIFKPLKKPKKIFVKVLKDTSFLKDTQNTQNFNSKKTADVTSLKSNNNIINVTEKINDETNK